ncbi:thyroid hormone receptor interactor 10b isoform X3 [Gasterosteus aculeatus]|uniref:thyroid hormone receptor interactor 10b isoform X2 n=1 Tax=Gasterosteus aculeatus aculeatus TaxID=481459 RepID=UPI001A990C0F|nr:thyroid hormone receptor interactor 10b isoform X2 [Gasterosteus aculeatus aculeatus]
MEWGADLWDQYDQIDKHTLTGLDLVDRYIKFVKERTEIEQNYAKQLRSLSKKYAKRGSKEEQESKFSNHASLQEILNELNDYAGQRELIAENMTTGICVELNKYLQELKQERKTHLLDAKKAQQVLEGSFKQLESTKKRYAKEWAEAEKATQQAEKIESDLNATKIDVEKAKLHAHNRMHTAEECRNDYAAQLQKYNKEQNAYYYSQIPQIFNKMQDMDERRIRRLAGGYCQFSDIEKNVLPIITKCLDGISAAGMKINEKQDSMLFIEQHKSGFERPADIDFEDYTQGIKPATSDSSLNPPKVRAKLWPFTKKTKVRKSNSLSSIKKKRVTAAPAAEDFSHLPPEQRKKRLQGKIDDITKELQKTQDQSEALEKMKGVYEHSPQMGDPSSLEPQISETAQSIGRLTGELAKYETWLSDAVGGDDSSNAINNNTQHRVVAAHESQGLYSEFDDEFEDIETPVGQCVALYTFEGNSEGTVSVTEGEMLSIMENDKGDGWMRVLRGSGEEGYIPSSYVKHSP